MIGIDITNVKRIKKIVKNNANFIYKILHPNEIKILNTKDKKSYYCFIAGRWAIKEAIFKCNNNLKYFKSLDISYNNNGMPILLINNKASNIEISISHEKNIAIGVAISKNIE